MPNPHTAVQCDGSHFHRIKRAAKFNNLAAPHRCAVPEKWSFQPCQVPVCAPNSRRYSAKACVALLTAVSLLCPHRKLATTHSM
jgi:hypothetical protein